MANYTLADIKNLRELTGAGMMDVKSALEEAEGDQEKAIEILRLKGMKSVAKREGRATSEGLVAAKISGNKGYLIELGAETDFVAKNEKFIALGEQVLDAIVAAGAETLEAAQAAPVDGKTVEETVVDASAILGEKLELRAVSVVTADHFEVYLHRTNKDLPPQLGVVFGYSGDNAEVARSIAQHISFAAPEVLNREDVSEEAVENERRIVTEISINEGKPESQLPKIVEGRLNSFFKQVVLNEQEYALDNKLKVSQVVANAGLTVQGFARLRVGA
ncbi:MAG: translation elongation factor Ts [Microbacteriaceae bacterium]